MKIKAGDEIRRPARLVEQFVNRNPGLRRALADSEVTIGLAADPEFATPAHAAREAMYVGDAAHVLDAKRGGLIATDEVKELFKKNPSAVETSFVYDDRLGKYRLLARKRVGKIGDGYPADAAPDLIAAQQISPWNAGWFQSIFKAPLLYSHASELVEVQSGTEPWADVMNLNLADYAGFAVIDASGRPSNNEVQDVNIQSGIMTSPVINMTASYTLSIEEVRRAEQSGSPFGSQLITTKQQYADYVLGMMQDYITYYGNSATATTGIFNVPSSITSWGGTSLNGIALGASATKGSDMYSALISIIVPFLTGLYNKVEEMVIAVSPTAYNLLTSHPYSAIYNPESALKAMLDNFMAGKGENGDLPSIKIVADPLLAPSTIFNAQTYDYTVLIAKSLRTGPDKQKQPMVLFGAPLQRFVYPTIPGSYATHYKFLRRIAGVFGPVPGAVVVYSGFGIKSPST